MKEIFNELAIIGNNISDEDRVVYLLASLLESFDIIVTALETNSTVPEIETVLEQLLPENRKLKEKDPSFTTESEGAMTLNNRRKGPQCQYCNKFGHIQQNCHEKEKKQKSELENHHHRSTRTEQKVNNVKSRKQQFSSEADVGQILQHVISADGMNKCTGTHVISTVTCYMSYLQ